MANSKIQQPDATRLKLSLQKHPFLLKKMEYAVSLSASRKNRKLLRRLSDEIDSEIEKIISDTPA